MFKLHLYDLSGIKLTGNGWGDDVFDGAEINSSGEVSIEITATGLNIYEGHLSATEVATATPIQVLNYDIPGLAGFRITGGTFGGGEDIRAKCTVGDLFYCSATHHFYAFPEEKSNSITDLTNTTWYFKDSLEHCWIIWETDLQCVSAACYNADFAVNLVVNDNQYDHLSFTLKGEGSPMADDSVYYDNHDSGDFIEAYYYGWEDESYRTITITGGEDVTNPDLITWITTNAVQTDISKPDAPEVGEGGHYLLFSSPNEFTLEAKAEWDDGMDEIVEENIGHWNGTMEYSTDAVQWNVWDGITVLSSAGGVLYVRGSNNTIVAGWAPYKAGGVTYMWVLTGAEVSCTGNIETLLDYKTVANGQHPQMEAQAFAYWWRSCGALVEAPTLGSVTLAEACYDGMFIACVNLRTIPELPATAMIMNCYTGMFDGCSSLKLSTEQTEEYKYEYRIPSSGTGTMPSEEECGYEDPSEWVLGNMFSGTGGTFTETPELNTVYYTSNKIVRAVEEEEAKPTFTFDLSTLNLASGKYTIYVTLGAEGYRDSEPSNEVVYEKLGHLVPENTYFEYWSPDGESVLSLSAGEPFPQPLPDDSALIDYTNSSSSQNDVIYKYSADTNSWRVWASAYPFGPTEVTIRESIGGAPVTAIDNAFWNEFGEMGVASGFEMPLERITIPKSITNIINEAFGYCFDLKEIIYASTIAEWNNINFSDDWNAGCSELTITCTDGIITIPAYNS